MKEILRMSNAEYHGETSRVSKSGLDVVARSPYHYYKRYLAEQRETQADSKALVIGSALHAAILEPDVFTLEYIRGIECDRRTAEGKKEWLAFLTISGGKIVLAPADYDNILEMRTAVLAHPIAANLLSEGQAEGSIFFDIPAADINEPGDEDPLSEPVKCKLRFDWLHASGTVIVDLKTTEDASPEAFFKSVANYGYHKQGAFYLDGFAYAGLPVPSKFVLVAIEKSAPYGVGVYYLPEEAIEVGRGANFEALRTYAKALKNGRFDGYTATKILPVKLPGWALTK